MTPNPTLWFVAVEGPMGRGAIDNMILQPSVHEAVGGAILLSLLITAGLLIRLFLTRKPVDRVAKVAMIVSQALIMVQALLGIKLLDQGMGTAQLYIHYVGGLIPLGLFVIASWFAIAKPRVRAGVLATVASMGLISAAMAFFIGRAYVRSGGAGDYVGLVLTAL